MFLDFNKAHGRVPPVIPGTGWSRMGRRMNLHPDSQTKQGSRQPGWGHQQQQEGPWDSGTGSLFFQIDGYHAVGRNERQIEWHSHTFHTFGNESETDQDKLQKPDVKQAWLQHITWPHGGWLGGSLTVSWSGYVIANTNGKTDCLGCLGKGGRVPSRNFFMGTTQKNNKLKCTQVRVLRNKSPE